MTDSCRFHCTVPHDYLQILMTFMTSNSEKKILAEVRLIHAEQMSLYDFIVLRKNSRHSWRLNKPSKTFQINGNLLVSLNCKVLLCLRNKNFLTEIYRNIQTFAFKVLQKCSSWASRNGAAQMFFSDSEQKHAWWKICKVRKVFDCVARAYYFQCQMSKVVWAKL